MKKIQTNSGRVFENLENSKPWFNLKKFLFFRIFFFSGKSRHFHEKNFLGKAGKMDKIQTIPNPVFSSKISKKEIHFSTIFQILYYPNSKNFNFSKKFQKKDRIFTQKNT